MSCVVALMNLPGISKLAGPLAVTALLATAAVAWAAPDRETAMSASVSSYKWDGGPVTGSPFASVDDDDTLIALDAPGTLKVVFSEADDSAVDIDLYIFKSDAAGKPVGDAIVSSEEGGSDEMAQAKISAPGKFLVRAQGFAAAEGFYKGAATFTSSAAAAPAPTGTGTGGASGGTTGGSGGTTPQQGTPISQAPAPAANAAPEAKIGKLAKAAKVKKLKGFSGTASDDKGVAKVQIALVLKKGKKCTQLKSNGKFAKLKKCAAPTSFVSAKGTATWSYKLKRKLAKGSYTLFARATDNVGQKQLGFTAGNKKTFKVK